MADYVIDEWLWSDLSGENDVALQRETFSFLEALRRSPDRLVVVEGSRFNQKADAFWSHTDRLRRGIARMFKDEFLYNALNCLRLRETNLVAMPPAIAPDVKDDDHYLVRAALSVQAELIVTTDGPLLAALTKHGLACQHRGQFLPGYIRQHDRSLSS